MIPNSYDISNFGFEAPEIVASYGGAKVKTWRAAKGKFRVGRGDGDEIRDCLTGTVVGVRVHHSDYDGVSQTTFELDFHSAESGEMETVKTVALTSDGIPSITASSCLAQIMMSVRRGAKIKLAANGGDGPKTPTYVNCYLHNPATGEYDQQIKTKRLDGEWEDVVAKIEKAILAHPDYKQRLKPGHYDDEAARNQFDALLTEKGWPTTRDARAEWLSLANKALKTTYTNIDNLADADWEELGATIRTAKTMPAILAPYVKPAADDSAYDPFADE